jgi:hypothetical protein
MRAPWIAREALAAYFADQLAEAPAARPVRLARTAVSRR